MKNKLPNNVIELWKGFKKADEHTPPPNFRVIEQIANFFSSGAFFYYIFDFTRFEMLKVSDSITQLLGIKPHEFSAEKYQSLIHEEDKPLLVLREQVATTFLFDFLPPEKITRYKVSYSHRIQKSDGSYYHNLHQATALNLTSDNSLATVIGVETDITHLQTVPKSSVSFIDLEGEEHFLDIDVNTPQFIPSGEQATKLSKQELKVLLHISYGFTNEQIASKLNVSPHTIKTHRKNILSKEGESSITTVVANYLRNGLI